MIQIPRRSLLASLVLAFATSSGAQSELTVADVTFERQAIESGTGEDMAAAGDVDGDGAPELLVASQEQAWLRVLRLSADGDFERLSENATPPSPNDLRLLLAGALDDLHIVIAHHETEWVSILSMDADGIATHRPESPVTVMTRPHAHQARLARIDGDAFPDLIIDDREGAGVRIHRGLADGHFQLQSSPVALGGDPYLGFAIGDLDGDGDVDIVSPNPRAVGVALNRSDPDLHFDAPTLLEATVALRPFCVALADFDADGDLDIAAASEAAGFAVHRWTNDGYARFTHAGTHLEGPSTARCVQSGNLDGNAYPDLLVTSWADGAHVLLNEGTRLRTIRLDLPGIANPMAGTLADFNGDGIDDPVILDGSSIAGVVLLSRR